jgi:hypothetical protein
LIQFLNKRNKKLARVGVKVENEIIFGLCQLAEKEK